MIIIIIIIQLEDEKVRQKKARDTLFNKNRNLGFSSIAEDASKRDEAFDNDDLEIDDKMIIEDDEDGGNEEEEEVKESAAVEEDGVSTLFDAAAIGKKDNTQKAYYKALRNVVDAADVILEVLDARDPLGCRAKEIEEMIINNVSTKKIILVLNKIGM